MNFSLDESLKLATTSCAVHCEGISIPKAFLRALASLIIGAYFSERGSVEFEAAISISLSTSALAMFSE